MLGFWVLVDMDQPQLTKVVYDAYKALHDATQGLEDIDL